MNMFIKDEIGVPSKIIGRPATAPNNDVFKFSRKPFMIIDLNCD